MHARRREERRRGPRVVEVPRVERGARARGLASHVQRRGRERAGVEEAALGGIARRV